MDDADLAQTITERMEALARDTQAARGVPGPRISPWTHCHSCGDAIPAERRVSVPTTRHCKPCAEELESLMERGLL